MKRDATNEADDHKRLPTKTHLLNALNWTWIIASGPTMPVAYKNAVFFKKGKISPFDVGMIGLQVLRFMEEVW